MQMRVQQGIERRRLEWRAARNALVDDAPERIEVRPGVGYLAADELRTEVRESAPEVPARLQHLATDASARTGEEPKVHEHGLPIRANEDVGRLQITMNNPFAVHERERSTDADV